MVNSNLTFLSLNSKSVQTQTERSERPYQQGILNTRDIDLTTRTGKAIKSLVETLFKDTSHKSVHKGIHYEPGKFDIKYWDDPGLEFIEPKLYSK